MRESRLSREQALTLLKKYNQEPFHLRHALTVEGVMRWYANALGYAEPQHEMEKVLLAAAELTGLIWSAALMRPSKSVADMELSSLKKKVKDKKFAAGCSRDVIRSGAERLGWELDRLLEQTLQAMRSCEAAVNAAMAAQEA